MTRVEFFKKLMIFIHSVATGIGSAEDVAKGSADLIKQFEAEIRLDQKLRCAASINKVSCHIFDQGFFYAISINDARDAVMGAD